MILRMLAPLAFGLIGVGMLVSLGVWQSQRLIWKEGVLADIATRISKGPVELPTSPNEAQNEYLAVQASGQFLTGEIHIYTSSAERGAGFRVVSPFQTGDRVILVDRGFIRQADKDKHRALISGEIVGNLLWPNEVDPKYTPAPNLETNTWFARDLPAMASHFNAEALLVVLSRKPKGENSVSPWRVATAGIANNHLEYAITWFLMAMAWFGMTVYWLWRIRRGKD